MSAVSLSWQSMEFATAPKTGLSAHARKEMPRYTGFVDEETFECEEEHEIEDYWNLADYDDCLHPGQCCHRCHPAMGCSQQE
jgi:hypothetical protein